MPEKKAHTPSTSDPKYLQNKHKTIPDIFFLREKQSSAASHKHQAEEVTSQNGAKVAATGLNEFDKNTKLTHKLTKYTCAHKYGLSCLFNKLPKPPMADY